MNLPYTGLFKMYPIPTSRIVMVKYRKGKIHPRTVHEGPEGSRGIDLLFL